MNNIHKQCSENKNYFNFSLNLPCAKGREKLKSVVVVKSYWLVESFIHKPKFIHKPENDYALTKLFVDFGTETETG